jgi:GT2 family glycosyltransferase
MDVSIIIVNYNTISFLVGAIDSILVKTKDIEYEIIVVDNNSSDDSKKIISEKYNNKVIHLNLSKNIGFGRANNEAVKIAKGRNLFFLNPDTILLNNAVKILSDYLDQHIDVGACGGNLFDGDMQPAISFTRMFPSLFQVINEFLGNIIGKIAFRKNICFNYTNRDIKVACVIGADMMIGKELFNNLGGFDPDFFLYQEEIELGFRINKAGKKIYSVPNAHIQHLEGKSISDNYERLRKKTCAYFLFLRKTQNKIVFSITYVIFYLSSLIRLYIFSILRNKEKIVLWSEINKISFFERNKRSVL